MAELKKNRSILLFVLLMILPAHALDVIFSSAQASFKQKYEIKSYIKEGQRMYGGTENLCTYWAKSNTTKVIVYIIDRSRFVEIFRNAVRAYRFQIAHELSEWHCELAFLGIDNFDDDQYYLISAFMVDKIRPNPQSQTNFDIETIGENRFDHVYQCHVLNIEEYQENAQICGGTLRSRLRDIPRRALRPVGSNNKEIRFYGYHPNVGEVRWPVRVTENDKYFPKVNVSDPKHNFKIRYPDKKICILVLGGKEYSAVTSFGKRSLRKAAMETIFDEMTNNDEVLFILGAFHFDWTEIDIVTQIILKHSEGCQDSEGWKDLGYNVYTCGYGMFNTAYLNMDTKDGRFILQQTNSYVLELIKVLMGKKVKKRAIIMYYSDDVGWKPWEIPINLGNGRYIAEGELIDYSFPWVDQKIAFIVHDTTEKNDQIDYSMVNQSVEKMKQSGIYVVLIEAINFGLDDMHIIAEWIDWHRGAINPEQIAVLGGGIFDTIFQSHYTTYNTLLNTKKNALKTIRNAYVKSGNGKRVFAAKIDDPNFEVWSFPMNTVNGFYEPDLIPDNNMFDTKNGKKIFFIITSAYIFRRISAMDNVGSVTAMLRETTEKFYPMSAWSVFLVGLDNFGEIDYHLFAELIKRQINDERSLQELVRVFNYAIGTPLYQSKNISSFPIETRPPIYWHIRSFFQMICGRP